MLMIKRHLPINKLALTRLWLSIKDFWWHAGVGAWRGMAPLVARVPHSSRMLLASLFIVLVGFFGSLAAFIGLKPVAIQGVANPRGVGQQANATTLTTSSVPINQQPTPAAAGPVVSSSPTVAQSPLASSPSAMQPLSSAAATSPVAGSVATTPVSQPGMGSVAPAPATTDSTTTSSTPPASSTVSSPDLSSAVQSTTDTVQTVVPQAVAPVTAPVLDDPTKLPLN